MKRFYGSAVFEGEEVADSAFTQLQNIRGEETRRIEYYKTEFQMQYNELIFWRAEELTSINTHAYNQIDTQNRLIAQYHREIAQIQADTSHMIDLALTHEEREEADRIRADADRRINELTHHISHCHREIAWTHSNRLRLIARVHWDFAIEYKIQVNRRDKDIAWAHSDATDRIAAVIARRYHVPVLMMRCAKGPCEFCRAKYGTTGTRDELEKLKSIPPFHDDCRCWLEEVGYVVMTH